MIIISLTAASLFLYQIFFYRRRSILQEPSLRGLVFYRDYLLLTMLPYLYYFVGDRYKDHYILSALGNREYFEFAAINAFIFIMGFLMVYRLLELPLRSSIKKIKISYNVKILLVLLNIFFISSFLFFLYISYVYKAGIVALLQNLTPVEINMKRAQLSGLGLEKILIKSWLPACSYLYLYLYLKKKYIFDLMDRILLILSIATGVLASVWFLEKAVLFFYVFGLVGVWVYCGRRINKMQWVMIFVLAFVVIGAMYIVTYGDRVVNFDYLSSIILHRLTTQSVGSVMSVHYFENHNNFYLTGVSNLLASLSGSEFRSVYSFLMDYYLPELGETSGSLSSFAAGDAYGLFGLLGVVLGGGLVGVYYAFFDATRESEFLAIIFVGLYGIYFSHFYIASSFYQFLWPVGMVLSIAPFALMSMFSSIVSKRQPVPQDIVS